jgi:hypothetical protein
MELRGINRQLLIDELVIWFVWVAGLLGSAGLDSDSFEPSNITVEFLQ